MRELDIINEIRGKVVSRKEHTGTKLFLVFGYITLFMFMAEFLALELWNTNLCTWLWLCILIVGMPLMGYHVRKDFNRTGRRTPDEYLALQLWLFVGGASAMCGLTTGFAGVYEQCYCLIQGLLLGMGCFLTGAISRFRTMVVCGIIGALLSFVCLFFQGVLWPWQLLIMALVTIITLVIPGHACRRYINNEKI